MPRLAFGPHTAVHCGRSFSLHRTVTVRAGQQPSTCCVWDIEGGGASLNDSSQHSVQKLGI